MKRKFGKPLSIALAGALAVGSVGMTPLTAYAANVGDVVFFQTGTSTGKWTVNGSYSAESGNAIVATASGSSSLFQKSSKLPVAAGALLNGEGSAAAVPDGFDFTWVSGNNVYTPSTNDDAPTYADVVTSGGAATLTATLTGKTIGLSFDLGADDAVLPTGKVEPTTKTYRTNLAADKTVVNPTRPGYDFVGWDYDGNGTADIAYDVADVDGAIDDAFALKGYKGNLSFEGVWNAQDYAIEYVPLPAGAEFGTSKPGTKTFDKALTKAISDAKYDDNHVFDGWDLNDDGKADIEPGADAVAQSKILDNAYKNGTTGKVTLAAIFAQDKFTVTYDANGDDVFVAGGTTPVTLPLSQSNIKYDQLDSTYVGADGFDYDDVARVGYELETGKEWSLSPTYIETPTAGDVYANAGGNTTKLGAIFKFTSTKSDLQKEALKNKSATLYLNWKEKKYKVSLDASGFRYADASSSVWTPNTGKFEALVKYTGTVTLPKVVDGSVIDGNNEIYFGTVDTFKGWALASDATKVVYKAGDVVRIDKDDPKPISLVPVFESATKEATVSFKKVANDATGNMEDVTVTIGEKYTLPECGFEYTGWTFTGWKIDNKSYKVGATVEIAANTDVEATWSENSYTVEFFKGTQSVRRTTIKYSVPVELPVVSSTTKTLLGWSTDATATVPEYNQGLGEVSKLVAENNGNISLYSVFVDDAVEVTYHRTGNEGSTGDTTFVEYIEKNKNYKIATTEVNNGYKLVGWTTVPYTTYEAAKKDKAEIFEAGKEVKAEKNANYYALYDANALTIGFKANGGDGSMTETVTATYNLGQTKYKLDSALPASKFTKFGYTQDGWALEDDGIKVLDNLDEEGTFFGDAAFGVEDPNFYAHWSLNNYRLSFDANGATGTMTSIVSCAINDIDGDGTADTQIITNRGFSNDDKTKEFGGWALDSKATLPEFRSGVYADEIITAALTKDSSIENGGTITVYAVWVDSAEESAQKVAEAEKKAAEDVKKAQDDAKTQVDAANKKATDAETAKTEADKKAAAAATDAANQKAAADAANQKAADAQKTADSANAKLKLSTALTANAGKTKKVSGTSYKTDADAGKSVAVTKGKNVKTLTIGKTVKIGGNTYKVRALNAKAFTGKKIRTIKIAGNNLKTVDVNAFKNTKATKITITKCKAVKKQLQAAAKAAGLKCTVKGTTATITKK